MAKVDLTPREIALLRELVRMADQLGHGEHPDQSAIDSLQVKLDMVR